MRIMPNSPQTDNRGSMINGRPMRPMSYWKTSEFFTAQFGGTAEDALYDVKVLASGDYVLFGRTKSTTFCGIDISAYTDGSYYAWFFLKVSSNFYPTGIVIKASYFLKGDTKQCGYSAGGKFANIEIDADDNVFYLWGSLAAGNQPDWKIYGIRTSDMTLVYTANTAITVNCTGTFSYAIHKRYNNNWYVCFYNGVNCYIQLLSSTLNQISNSSIFAGEIPADMFINANGVFIYTAGLRLIKATTAPAYSANVLMTGTFQSSGADVIAGSGTDIYIAGVMVGDNDLVVAAVKQSDLSAKAGWANYQRAIAVGKIVRMRGIVYDSDGRLFLAGFTSDTGAVGIYDCLFVEVSPTTGASISDNWIRDFSGTTIGQAGKTCLVLKPIIKIATGRYMLLGQTDGNLTGFSNLGGSDAMIVKIDATGKILG